MREISAVQTCTWRKWRRNWLGLSEPVLHVLKRTISDWDTFLKASHGSCIMSQIARPRLTFSPNQTDNAPEDIHIIDNFFILLRNSNLIILILSKNSYCVKYICLLVLKVILLCCQVPWLNNSGCKFVCITKAVLHLRFWSFFSSFVSKAIKPCTKSCTIILLYYGNTPLSDTNNLNPDKK